MTDDLQDRDTPDTGIESDDPRRSDNDPRGGGMPQADEIRKADDREPTGRDAPAGAPAARPDWAGEEWAGDNQPGTRRDEDARAAAEDAGTGTPKWNAHEFVGEGQGAPDEGPGERVVPTEGENELSGHGHNPGGGERWADVDPGLSDEVANDTANRSDRLP